MSSTMAFDIESLLLPLSTETPAGSMLSILERNSLKDYREDFDPERDLLEEDRSNPIYADKPRKLAQWEKIIQFGAHFLTNSGKDLTVALFMVEASTQLLGYCGLCNGLRLLRRLCEECWDRLHPMIEDPSDLEQLEARVTPFGFIENEIKFPFFPNTIRTIPLCHTVEGHPISYNTCRASSPGGQPQVSPDAFRNAVLTFSDKAAQEFQLQSQSLQAAEQELRQLSAVLQNQVGSLAPSFAGLMSAIQDCLNITKEVSRIRDIKRIVSLDDQSLTPSGPFEARASHVMPSGDDDKPQLQNREDIYRRLQELILLLEQCDPHSPVPFLIRRAIEMRDMRFPELVDVFTSQKPMLDFIRESLHGDSEVAN